MTAQVPETAEKRLQGVRELATCLCDTSDPWAWEVALAIKQLCMGTITVAQALAQLDR